MRGHADTETSKHAHVCVCARASVCLSILTDKVQQTGLTKNMIVLISLIPIIIMTSLTQRTKLATT